MKNKILPNMRFARLNTIKYELKTKKWLCKCICGNEIWVKNASLKSKKTKSCGCLLKDFCKNRFIDMRNQKFGKLLVISKIDLNNDYRGCKWICSCDCGKSREVYGADLRRGYVSSCGCSDKSKKNSDKSLIGRVFGKLTVLGFFHKKPYRVTCKCSCGIMMETTIYRLKDGTTKSCGCISNSHSSKHPRYKPSLRTRKTNTPEYINWRMSVFIRDEFRCQFCCKQSNVDLGLEKLNAHHIDSWADYPEKRLDINNGLTLCESCHQHLHKLFGKKTTSKDIEKYKDLCWID